MKVLDRVGHKFSRLRHARGFGIHSPFAFSLVTEVFGENAEYYSYDVIRRHRRLLAANGAYLLPLDRLLLLFRILNRFEPRHILRLSDTCGEELPAILEADSRSELHSVSPGGVPDLIAEAYPGRVTDLTAPFDFLFVGPISDGIVPETIAAIDDAISRHVPVMFLAGKSSACREAIRHCRETMTVGQVFHNDGDTAFAATLPHLPRQDFRIEF